MMRKTVACIAVLALSVSLLGAQAKTKKLLIGTSSVGGTYYVWGAG